MSKTNIIYRYFNKHNEVIYVGLTARPLNKRVKEHQAELLQTETDHIDFAEVKSEADMRMYELYYINKYRPKYNKRDLYFDGHNLQLPELIFIPYIEKNTDQRQYVDVDKRDYVFECPGGSITLSVLDPMGKSPDTVMLSVTGAPKLTRDTLRELISLATDVQDDLAESESVTVQELLSRAGA